MQKYKGMKKHIAEMNLCCLRAGRRYRCKPLLKKYQGDFERRVRPMSISIKMDMKKA